MVYSILRPLVRSVLFWLGLFLLQSLLFLFFAWSRYPGTLGEAALSLWHGLRMHIATASILSFPWFLGGIWVLLSSKHAATVSAVLKVWMWIALGVVCTVGAADMALFHAWGSKLNLQALEYLHYPREAMSTIFDASNLLYAGAAFGLFLFGFLILRRMKLRIVPTSGKPNHVVQSVSLILIAGLFLISARGGVKSEVLNRNHVFRSGHSVLNYTALNSFWNFMDLLMSPAGRSARYSFVSETEAEQTLLQMQQVQEDSTLRIIHSGKTNVIIVMLESWGSDAVECVGGEKGVAPRFSQLADEGLLFNRFFASGTRTEQGLLAVLSGMPARPVGSAIQSFGTFDHLPNLYNVFTKQGYHTSYYYGGRLSFDNVEAYLRSAGVQHMVGIQEVNPQRKTKWGAYDEEVLNLQIKELGAAKKPFFSVLSTLTSHEWFDADVPSIFRNDPDHVNDDYRNTVHYADSCVFAWFNSAKKQPWYANTIMVLVADHACNFPRHRDLQDTGRFQIPMLIAGGALKPEWRGRKISVPGSQVDIAATLLAQLGLKEQAFEYSKNLLNPAGAHFAWYAFDHGFGYITPSGSVVYDHNSKKVRSSLSASEQTESHLKQGKCYLQCVANPPLPTIKKQ